MRERMERLAALAVSGLVWLAGCGFPMGRPPGMGGWGPVRSVVRHDCAPPHVVQTAELTGEEAWTADVMARLASGERKWKCDFVTHAPGIVLYGEGFSVNLLRGGGIIVNCDTGNGRWRQFSTLDGSGLWRDVNRILDGMEMQTEFGGFPEGPGRFGAADGPHGAEGSADVSSENEQGSAAPRRNPIGGMPK